MSENENNKNPRPDVARPSSDQGPKPTPKKPYTKPQLVRYGTVHDLTASGNSGTQMDAQFPTGGLKTGF